MSNNTRIAYIPSDTKGTHPCGREGLQWYETRSDGKEYFGKRVYRCRTDNSGPVPAHGGINPDWPAAWAEYQAQKAATK